jgi:hypothetical protein
MPRRECDLPGERQLPDEARHRVLTLRALEDVPCLPLVMHGQFNACISPEDVCRRGVGLGTAGVAIHKEPR